MQIQFQTILACVRSYAWWVDVLKDMVTLSEPHNERSIYFAASTAE